MNTKISKSVKAGTYEVADEFKSGFKYKYNSSRC
jgi:hypothetical protein